MTEPCLPAAVGAELLPVDHQAGPPSLLLRDHPCPLHAGLGLHPGELQAGLPAEPRGLLRAGPDGPPHPLGPEQLPAAAAGREPTGRSAPGHLPETAETPGVREAEDGVLGDPGAGREGPVRRLPVQRHRRELGEEASRLGDADGELAHRGRHQDPGGAGPGPVPGPGGGEDEEADGGCGEGGGAVSSA